MNGAEILIKTAIQAGIEVCFANAGTTEIPILGAFDTVPGIRTVLGLFEGVCTGAADGYGRMLNKPAMALLHHGPGLANGIANLHNARRAKIPMLTVVGDHVSWHRPADPPLTMDIESLVGTFSGWYKRCESVETISQDVADALSEAMTGQISTLIISHDIQWSACPNERIAIPATSFEPVADSTIERITGLLRDAHRPALLLGGSVFHKRGLIAASRIKAATGCDIVAETFPAYMERGAGLPLVERIPYFPEGGIELMSQYDLVLLVGAHDPVTFFGYKDTSSFVVPVRAQKIHLCSDKGDPVEALEALAEAVGTTAASNLPKNIFAGFERPAVPQGSLTADTVCMVIAALQPEGAIIVDEGLTTALPYFLLSRGAPPHSYTAVTGGAIGYGMPCAVGAAIACPDRPVINFQADGSALYTLQALWTEARESLNVTTLICSNRSYHILKMELLRAGTTSFGAATRSLIEFDKPPVDWVKIASGFGVPAVSVDTAEGLAKELTRALAETGPHLIEMKIIAESV